MNTSNAILVVWEGTVVEPNEVDEFEEWVQEEFGVSAQYETQYETLPTMQLGEPVQNTGGRNDLLFWVSQEDIGKFAIPRLAYGMRWWSDAVSSVNGGGELVPDEILTAYGGAA